ESLRARHPGFDPAVDLVKQLVDQDVGRDLLQHPAVRVYEADVPAARNPEVRVTRLARPVHRAAHHRDLERLRVVAQAVLHDDGQALDADVVAPARRARDHHRPALAQPERLQDLPGDLDLLHGVGSERDPHRVADAVHQERPHPYSALDRPGERRPRLGNAEVERVGHLLGQHPVRADHRRHVRGLHRDLEVAEIQALQDLDLLERLDDERLGRVLARERLEVLRQRAGVGADPHGDPGVLCGSHDLLGLVRPADVAGVDTDGVDAGVDRVEGERGVEVDVGDHRDRREADDQGQRPRVLLLRDGDAHDLAAGGGERGDLRRRGLDVVGLREGHGLDDDRRAAADRDAADADLVRARHRGQGTRAAGWLRVCTMPGVPAEPPPTPWRLEAPPDDYRDDLWAVGADLAPGTLLAAYRLGLFPMPVGARIGWFSPARRGVVPLGPFAPSRSLRRARRRYEIRVDTAFAEVVRGCARPGDAASWIEPSIESAYGQMHELGWAHSVEAWDADGLAGGLYGVAI